MDPCRAMLVFLLVMGLFGYGFWRKWRLMRSILEDGPAPDPLCEACGYNLRASPDRCPECGTVTPMARSRQLQKLSADWPDNPIVVRKPRADEEACVLLSSDNGKVMELLQQHLEARGIASRVELPQPLGNAGRRRIFTGHKLVVWSGDVAEAEMILQRLWPQEYREP